MSLEGSPVSSKLLIENWNFNVSGTSPADTRVCSRVEIQQWSCFVDNVSSGTKV